MQVDTLKFSQHDSSGLHHPVHINKQVTDTHKIILRKTATINPLISKQSLTDTGTNKSDSVSIDTLTHQKTNRPKDTLRLIDLFPTYRHSFDSSVVKITDKSLLNAFTTNAGNKENLPVARHINNYNNWLTGLSIIIAIILIYIQTYFQKYLSSIASSVFNLQIAEKLMHEKNVLIRRVFFILNTIFLLTISLYVLACFRYFNLPLLLYSNLVTYLAIIITILVLMLIKLMVQRMVGYLFESEANFNEYIHTSYLLNKNLGIYLLPFVVSFFFLKDIYADTGFYICTGLVAIWLIYKYIRALQIIIKQKVFLLYSILYLCTLEILPVLIGIKFVLSLR